MFVDLGMHPLCETFPAADEIDQMEPFFPLYCYVCEDCFLVQLKEYVTPEDIFTEYAYFSSYSDSWLAHARKYCEEMTERLGLNDQSFVVELASNDGYLLQNFVKAGVPCLGIEPAANVAKVAEEKGVPSLVEFFGVGCAQDLVSDDKRADLILGNNVLAQVPDLNDFIGGMKVLLKPGGVITIEFPHLLCLMRENQFDTIYHEHFSYFSLISTQYAFGRHGLEIFDVEELPSHGGSLRIFARHADDDSKPTTDRLKDLHRREVEAGFDRLEGYTGYRERVEETKRALLDFLIGARREGKSVVGYGAPGKGNTLLNYCGIRTDFLDFLVDRNPYKHGRFAPGTHIPIFAPEKIDEVKPDYILILPWNLRKEIAQQLDYTREWGTKLVVPIPELEIF
jgi:SAM-dependent methyltransferase